MTDLGEILSTLTQEQREALSKKLRPTFDFKINASFLNSSAHPLTIPKECYPFMEFHGIINEQNATVIFPDGSTAAGYIYRGRNTWGVYYQIKIRSFYSAVGISNFKIDDVIRVEIFKVDGKTQIELSNKKSSFPLV